MIAKNVVQNLQNGLFYSQLLLTTFSNKNKENLKRMHEMGKKLSDFFRGKHFIITT